MRFVALFLFISFAICEALGSATFPTPLAIITPCPSARFRVTPTLITITSQYQPVSTCFPTSTCLKRRCKTRYSYDTYLFVSTVLHILQDVPLVTTISGLNQSVLVSKTTSTSSNTKTITKTSLLRGKPTSIVEVITVHQKIVKQWSAKYKDLGPLALAGYPGSGLCTSCQGVHGEQVQVLNLTECINASKPKCRQRFETWILPSYSASTVRAVATCSSRKGVGSAGVYTFTFPQKGNPITFRVPRQVITLTAVGPRPTVTTTTFPPTVTTLPGQPWNAYLTRSCRGPTVFDFTATVTETITYYLPPMTVGTSEYAFLPRSHP